MTELERSGSDRDGDWSTATWEGARLEQMRRWAALPLEQAILALEEMEELARELQSGENEADEAGECQSHRRSAG